MEEVLQVSSESLSAGDLDARLARSRLARMRETGGKARAAPAEGRAFEPDDLDLVGRGDEAALRRVMEEYSSLVYGIALRVTGSEADATDVLQEVFIALPERLESFDGDHFACWLKVVARRQALMRLRSERRRDEYEAAPIRPDDLEGRTLEWIDLERAVSRLDPVRRAVFLLWHVEGFTHAEIGNQLGISEGASQVKLYRARRTLRKLLTR